MHQLYFLNGIYNVIQCENVQSGKYVACSDKPTEVIPLSFKGQFDC